MDPQTWQMIFTGILAVATIVYTTGTLLLWSATRRLSQAMLAALQLNVICALRQPFNVPPTRFLRLLRQALPKECSEFVNFIEEEIRKQHQPNKDPIARANEQNL